MAMKAVLNAYEQSSVDDLSGKGKHQEQRKGFEKAESITLHTLW